MVRWRLSVFPIAVLTWVDEQQMLPGGGAPHRLRQATKGKPTVSARFFEVQSSMLIGVLTDVLVALSARPRGEDDSVWG